MNRGRESGTARCGWLAVVAAMAVMSSLRAEVAVETEAVVYRYTPADNGAGPMWCSGSTCLVRGGDTLFASGIETLPNVKPLNNCRWLLFRRRATGGWEQVCADPKGRTREPSPLAVFPDGRFFLSANPTLVPGAYNGPARPEIFEFAVAHPEKPARVLRPKWRGQPKFTEHSYRSFAADGPNRELILFQNIGYTHAEWAFLDRDGHWSAQGRLKWPWGADYAKPQPIRVCYPDVALKERAVYFCGVSDIMEPNPEWRAYKNKLTGRHWDYDFRRLFFTWTPDITAEPFRPWVEIASREATCGWILPGDLWVAPDRTVHVVWSERAIDERLRAKFFPDARQSYALKHAALRDGRVIQRNTLLESPTERPGRARFHLTPDGRVFVIFYVAGRDAAGRGLSENRLGELRDGKFARPPVRVPLKHPLGEFFTATPRAGSPPAAVLDLLGERADEPHTIGYARVRP
jgi:hypothetical protein